MPKAYVIVGGSLAGATAAITLREESADGSVTLIGAEREPPYERPLLSKGYLRGEVPFDKALVRPATFYAENGIEFLVGVRARSGLEFGLGPNLALDGAALAFAAGKSFNVGGVSIPVDLAVVSSQGGVRTTLLLGYAVQTPNEE